MRLLIVDSDTATARSIARELEKSFHHVLVAGCVREARFAIEQEDLDGIIMERQLPFSDGNVLLKEIRSQGLMIPVVILTAPSGVRERVEALDAGADDYLAKPVDIDELLARIRAIARRSPILIDPDIIKIGAIEVNLRNHRVTHDKSEVHLQPLEYKILIELIRQPDKVVSRKSLYKKIWGYDNAPKSNSIDSHIRRLRSKLSGDGGLSPIVTVRRLGYYIK
ncbi:response regulator transcription factor [Sphingomonas sp. A2-49]|uniref:response regulator transcription factor n=1 Tax=Sphingomonas sp. A2-49 TaxID=1391375 RepID=UPI0021D109A0|nr:response regulator transcription factor [Sphingomonas sp. A2-49]MCU6453397.1 response regulator transcription factor [Sphingomonas sp. A2-49]